MFDIGVSELCARVPAADSPPSVVVGNIDVNFHFLLGFHIVSRNCKTVFHNMENFSGRVKDHPSEVETVWERQNFLGAVRGGATRPAQGVGVGAANSRGERWVKICVMQAFREVFNIITIMLSKKQGRRHARDLNGDILRAVLPKGYEKARRSGVSPVSLRYARAALLL
ncbi:hypothetical protein [Parasutterella excrementihominis]|uniref:hypothetical protein n=1 Tax=Parasutterella excrementihominis TaxID=487175 RepID=UPI0027B96B5D|nr:hypothetical protein [Parasutterella excrementihominis]